MSKILVTGAKGQLGTEIRNLEMDFPLHKFLYTDILELDITNKDELNKYVISNSPEIIINCAAYNQVDKAEEEPGPAMKLNVEAVGNLASVAEEHDCAFIHISTDYVFDGRTFRPYVEDDKPNPLSKYALSKMEGEVQALKYGKKSAVVRTSWLYSPFGHNFVKTIRKYGRERGSLNVVNDQVGSPTFAADLAKAVLLLAEKVKEQEKPQIFHYSNEGIASWYDFAQAVIRISGIACIVNPVSTKEYPLPAKRPYYSVLSKKKIKEFLNISIPHWLDSLEDCINIITKTEDEHKQN